MFFVVGMALAVAVIVFYLWYDKLMADGFQWSDLIPSMLSAIVIIATMIPLYFAAKDSVGGDQMVLNGHVTGKSRVETSCTHSYSCFCTTVNKVRTCQTCYEHTHDYAWKVKSTVGSTYIDTVNRRGDVEPPRFTEVIVGEPFSKSESYFNYIKASPLSVFKDYNAYKDIAIPKYPVIYDYYRVKHTVDFNSKYKSGISQIDTMLSEKLKVTSAKVKANAVVIFYGGDFDIAEATRVKMFGGRINDLTVMIKADSIGNIEKVSVFSWSKNDLVNVKIRDDILELGKLNAENNKKLVDSVDKNLLKYYQKRDSEEFKYLEANVALPTWLYVVYFFVFSIILGVNLYLRGK